MRESRRGGLWIDRFIPSRDGFCLSVCLSVCSVYLSFSVGRPAGPGEPRRKQNRNYARGYFGTRMGTEREERDEFWDLEGREQEARNIVILRLWMDALFFGMGGGGVVSHGVLKDYSPPAPPFSR